MLKSAESFPNGIFAALRLRSRLRGFTLIELLVVMAIIMILASITFGITRGVQGAQARAKAQGELVVLAQALEQFKLRYGDYPHINHGAPTTPTIRNNSSHNLLRALTGWRDVTENLNAGSRNEELLDISRLSTQGTWTNPDAEPAASVYFSDPWGNAYVYLYRPPSGTDSWERFGYLLFSIGPNGRFSATGFDADVGTYNRAFREHGDNVDIIFAGE